MTGKADLDDDDVSELLGMVKQEAGFKASSPPPTPVPIESIHLGGISGAPAVRLKAVRNIKNVNRLAPDAGLNFKPDGLTVIYGPNGSGKTGYIRILRSACRTRIADPNRLKILADVYGPQAAGPREAQIVIETEKGEVTILWADNDPASDILSGVSVFDSDAARLYVGEGNQITFLPFGLYLPFQLNRLSAKIRSLLETEREAVNHALAIADMPFQGLPTDASRFYRDLNAKTIDDQIEAVDNMYDAQKNRIIEITSIIDTSLSEIADRRSLASWAEECAARLETISAALADVKVDEIQSLKREQLEAQNAADLAAKLEFEREPLAGVGGPTWQPPSRG